MALSIKQTDWHIAGPTLCKGYHYVGLDGSGSHHDIRLDVDKSPSLIGGLNVHVTVLIRPHLWPQVPGGYLVGQLAIRDAPAETPFTTVKIGTCDDGSMIIQPCDRNGAEIFFEVLQQAKMMRLILMNDKAVLAELPIPNDEQFIAAAKVYFGENEAPRAPMNSASLGFLSRLFG